MVARRERLEDRCGSRHSGRKKRRVGAVFELGDDRLRLVEGRIVGAGVDPPRAVLVVLIAQKGGRNMDRRGGRSRPLVDPAQGLRGDALGLAYAAVHRECSSSLIFVRSSKTRRPALRLLRAQPP